MKIEWNHKYELGVPQIDNQHKELFEAINNILESVEKGGGRAEVAGLLKFLEDYVIKHFSLEEALMKKHSYPNYDNHKTQHAVFMANFFSLKKFYEARGASTSFIELVEKWVTSWLKDHILNIDQKFGEFLKSNNLTNAG